MKFNSFFAKSLIFTTLLAIGGCSYTHEDLPPNVYKHRKGHQHLKSTVAILATSDSGRTNTSQITSEKLRAQGHEVCEVKILSNDQAPIEVQLNEWVAQGVPFIICLGGTGFSPRDLTINAIDNVIDTEIPGFGELFRYLSYEKWKHINDELGVLAMDTRAKAGIAHGTIIFGVPGSPDAVELALDKLIIPDMPYFTGHIK